MDKDTKDMAEAMAEKKHEHITKIQANINHKKSE